jgi:hypothetical protein
VAERVEETMLDPLKVGEVVAKLSIERDEARALLENARANISQWRRGYAELQGRATQYMFETDEARQVARDYRNGILRLDWYEWHEETVLADEAAAAEKYPWLKEET